MDVVVVAGGRGRRFGGDKVLHARGGGRQIDVVVQQLAGLGGRIVVACGPRPLGVPGTIEVVDDPHVQGPLAGVVAGLEAAGGDLVAVVAADLVAPSPALLKATAGHARGLGVPGAMPAVDGRAQPLHAVVDPGAAAALRTAAARTGSRLIESLLAIGVVIVDEATWRPWAPDAMPGHDIDTREDLDFSSNGPG